MIKDRIRDGTYGYRVRVRVKGHPPVIKIFSSLTLAKKWKKDTEVEIDKGRYFERAEAQKHTLSEAVDRYIKVILPSKPKNAKNIQHHLLWWKRELGHYSLDCVKPSLIAEKKDLLLTERIKDGEKTRSTTTAVRYISSLSHVFTVMVREWGWVTENPVRKIKKPPLAPPRVRFLSADEKIRLLDACQKSGCRVLYPVVILALSTGMRYSEIMKLKKGDIDLERGVITLRETKNGDVRSVPLVDAQTILLRERLTTMSEDELIFPSPNNPRKPIDVRSAWERAVKLANISDFRFHDLRHTVASYLAMSGYGLLDIGTLLGHKDMQSTKRYAHLSQEHKQRMVTTMMEKILR